MLRVIALLRRLCVDELEDWRCARVDTLCLPVYMLVWAYKNYWERRLTITTSPHVFQTRVFVLRLFGLSLLLFIFSVLTDNTSIVNAAGRSSLRWLLGQLWRVFWFCFGCYRAKHLRDSRSAAGSNRSIFISNCWCFKPAAANGVVFGLCCWLCLWRFRPWRWQRACVWQWRPNLSTSIVCRARIVARHAHPTVTWN